MAPQVQSLNVDCEPMSKTYQYRKVMKPMLERKRRARINRCLDELKEIIVGTLNSEESVTKLEKADILELTVRYLQRLKQQNKLSSNQSYSDRFQQGFNLCATEVSQFLCENKSQIGQHLIRHLGHCVRSLEREEMTPPPQPTVDHSAFTPVKRPASAPQQFTDVKSVWRPWG